jgi:hypothetical protein
MYLIYFVPKSCKKKSTEKKVDYFYKTLDLKTLEYNVLIL